MSNQHIMEALKVNTRYDGRKLEEFRDLSIETNVVSNAEGSSRVKLGNTEIIAGVKMSIGEPFPDRQEEGVLMVGAELLPLASPEYESGPPGIDAIEISRVIDRGVRESKMIDLKKLCIKKAEKVWMVQVDLVPVNADGNLFDAGAIAALAAIKSAKIPDVKDGAPDYKSKGKKSLPFVEEPIAVTAVKIGEHIFLDPTNDEEKLLDARLTVTVKKNGKMCSLQKGGVAPLSTEDIDVMTNLAIKKSKELRKIVDKVK